MMLGIPCPQKKSKQSKELSRRIVGTTHNHSSTVGAATWHIFGRLLPNTSADDLTTLVRRLVWAYISQTYTRNDTINLLRSCCGVRN